MSSNSDKAMYNDILIEFDFLFDMDMALFKYIRDNFKGSPYVDNKYKRMQNEYYIIRELLFRQYPNVLQMMMPDLDTDKLYNEIMKTKEDDLLKLAKPYDLLYLMNTFLNNAASITITVWCKNKAEVRKVKELAPRLKILMANSRKEIKTDRFSMIWVKFLKDAIEYAPIAGKYFYTAAAGYNYKPGTHEVYPPAIGVLGDVNIIKLVEPYSKVKYTYTPTVEEDKADEYLLQHSSRGEGTEGTAADIRYPSDGAV